MTEPTITKPADIEPASVDIRFPAALFAGIASFLGIAIAVTGGIYQAWFHPAKDERHIDQTAIQRAHGAAPLSHRQRQERIDYEKRERHLLTTYGWVDRQQGVARIPIEKAMQRLIQREGAVK